MFVRTYSADLAERRACSLTLDKHPPSKYQALRIHFLLDNPAASSQQDQQSQEAQEAQQAQQHSDLYVYTPRFNSRFLMKPMFL